MSLGCNVFSDVVLWPAHSSGELRCVMLGWKWKFSGCTVQQPPLKEPWRSLPLRVPGLQYSLCICSWFRICLVMSNYLLILSSEYDRVSGSLRFPTRIWNYSPLPRELMFFSFQICLGSADSHTLVYFFCVSCFMVVLSGRATIMNSTLLVLSKSRSP